MTPLHVEEPAEQVLSLLEHYSHIAWMQRGFLIPLWRPIATLLLTFPVIPGDC